ncbi:hypothetical protein BDQ12DRAFT_693160 [Crucibulum laeve]|uniref:Uncharacterized protein n=1 Tax=Crucibulum laeve TaxID=68775 RepID=A0A5C3LGV8_9AGAR|nr:hypothetical protein BDQ12DRAFT_693160 [Crucibulum laeve]
MSPLFKLLVTLSMLVLFYSSASLSLAVPLSPSGSTVQIKGAALSDTQYHAVHAPVYTDRHGSHSHHYNIYPIFKRGDKDDKKKAVEQWRQRVVPQRSGTHPVFIPPPGQRAPVYIPSDPITNPPACSGSVSRPPPIITFPPPPRVPPPTRAGSQPNPAAKAGSGGNVNSGQLLVKHILPPPPTTPPPPPPTPSQA